MRPDLDNVPHTSGPPPRIVWATRSFLEYRVPVFRALAERVDGNLWVLFAGDYVPASVAAQAVEALGDHAVPLRGEWKLGREDREFMANRNWSLRFQPGMWSRIRALRPDVLIGDGFFKWSFTLLALRILNGTPLVICYERTAHTERAAQRLRTAYRRWALKWTDAVNCSGRLCRAYTESLGMPSGRIREGHMVADVPRWQREVMAVDAATRARQRREWDAHELVILCVGRLTALKGGWPLLEAWARFEARHARRATLVFAGTGDLAAELADWSLARGLRDVRFIGAVPHASLAGVYAAADIVILPTREDNWSLVVPEAMACGLPVASSCYNGSVPEFVSEGETGWIFDPLAPASLDRLLDTILSQRHALPDMGRRAAGRVSAHTPAAAAESILETCRLALAHRRRVSC